MLKELLILAVFVGLNSAKVISKDANDVAKRGMFLYFWFLILNFQISVVKVFCLCEFNGIFQWDKLYLTHFFEANGFLVN
jgi:hypothetical protein